MEDEEKRDEEQIVRDTDADTADVDDEMKKDEGETNRDFGDVIRKLDALIESVSVVSKGIAQLVTAPKPSGNQPENVPSPEPFSDGIDDLDFKM